MRPLFFSRSLPLTRLFPIAVVAGLAVLAVGLTGCGVEPAGKSTTVTPVVPAKHSGLSGKVIGGQQPVSGAQVYLYAIGTTTGAQSQSLLTTSGGYVLTDSNGNWNISGDYTCPANAYVYILAVGGNPGLASGTNNPKLSLAAILGACSSLNSSQFFNVNEVTTVVAAAALANIATSETQIGTANLPLMVNAATFNTNMLTPATGVPLTVTPDRTGSVPQAKIDSLADAVAACVNTDGVTASDCQDLMDFSGLSNTSLTPDTFNAAIIIAQNPTNDPGDIFDMVQPSSPFQPTLIDGPPDWILAPQYSGEANLGNGTTVSPDSATIPAGGQISLTTGGGQSYLWTTSGALGTLSDPNGASGLSFCSTSATATYTSTSNSSFQSPASDVVVVQVFWVPSCVGNPGGQATAAVTTVPASPTILPASPSSGFSGQVQLPSGVQLNPDTLTVLDSITQTTPLWDGTFTLPYYNSGSQIVIVTSPDGTPMLAGWLDANHTKINESTTAEVLAFYALGGASMLEEADRQAAIAQIPQLNGFDTLVSTIDSELNANYDAFASNDANVAAALNNFFTETTGFSTNAVRVPFARPQDVFIDPTSPQSGVTVGNEEPPPPYSTTSTITPWATFVTNAYRRRTHYFLMKQYDTTNGVQTPLGTQVSDADLSPTVGVNGGVTGALTDIIKAYFGNQPTAYAPVTSDPLDLTPDSGVDSTTFQIINVGAGGSGAPSPVQLTAAQQTILVTTAVNGFVNDVIVPIVNNIVINTANNADSAANTPMSGSSNSAFVASLERSFSAALAQASSDQAQLVAGDYGTVLGDFLANLDGLPTISDLVQKAVVAAVPSSTTEAVDDAVKGFAKLMNAAGAGLQVFDTSVYLAQLAGSDNVDQWTVTSSKFKATLTPAATTFASLNNVVLQAAVLNVPSATQLSYKWTISPQAGQSLVGSISENGGAGRTLPDGSGNMSACSTSTSWSYSNNAAAFNALTMATTDTVTVLAYSGPNCQAGQDISNTPSATITNNANANVLITPATPTIEAGEYQAVTAAFTNPKLQTQTPPASWQWQLIGAGGTVYGTLSNSNGTAATSGATFCSTSASAQYTSTQSDPVTTSQTDQIEANAYAQPGCQGTPLSQVPGIASVTTRATPGLTISPTHALLEAGNIVTFTVSSTSLAATGFSYKWTTGGLVGTLTDTGGTGNTGLKTYCTTSNTATLVANTQTVTTPITDTVTVLAYAAPGCVADNQFGQPLQASVTLQFTPTTALTSSQMLGLMQASDGNMYGIGSTIASIPFSPSNFPAFFLGNAVYQITPNGQVSQIANLTYSVYDSYQQQYYTYSDGLSPLVEGPDDALYGIAANGGDSNCECGFFYKISLVDYSVTILHAFLQTDSWGTGSLGNPETFQGTEGPLVLANDGNFYVASGFGIAKLTPSGQLTLLAPYGAFGAVGYNQAPLMQASDGNLYGIANPGAPTPGNQSQIYSLSLSGSGLNVYTFPQNPIYTFDEPNPALVEGSDGALYGTMRGERAGFGAEEYVSTANNSENGYPTAGYENPIPAASIFRLLPGGGYSTIYNVDSLSDGTEPLIGLIPGPDGNLYGAFSAGGDLDTECFLFPAEDEVQTAMVVSPYVSAVAYVSVTDEGCGTIFRVSPSGGLTNMYTFHMSSAGRITNGFDISTSMIQGLANLALDASGNLVGPSAVGLSGTYGAVQTEIYRLPLFDGGPITMSFNPSTISLGSSATLTWSVSNAFSLGAQQCYAHNIAGGGGGTWTGLQAGTSDSTGFHGSANIQPTASGTYKYALTCGGTESGFATLTVQ